MRVGFPTRKLAAVEAPQASARPRRSRGGALRPPGRRLTLVALASVLILVGVGFSQGDRYSARLADFSRTVIGDERTLKVEGWYFSAHDAVSRLKYRAFGGSRSPFEHSAVEHDYIITGVPDDGVAAWEGIVERPPPPPPRPAPMELPETKALRASLAPGEGVWTAEGLPRSSPEDPLMERRSSGPTPHETPASAF